MRQTIGLAVNTNRPYIMSLCYDCRKFDIMDSMLHKLEKYADSLENIVQQRTAELIDEKQKTDMLLHRMLPTYAFRVTLFLSLYNLG